MEKAKAEIRRGAKTNGVEISEDLLDRIQAPAKEEKKEEKGRRPSFKDLFVNPCIRRRILAMAFSWIAAILCYNGLVFNSVNIGGSVYVNMALGVVIEVRMINRRFNFRFVGINQDNLSFRFRATSSAG